MAMKEIVNQHGLWQEEYQQIKNDKTLGSYSLLTYSVRGSRNLVNNLEHFKKLAGITTVHSEILDSRRLFEQIDANSLDNFVAIPRLNFEVARLLERMDEVIRQAQEKSGCPLIMMGE